MRNTAGWHLDRRRDRWISRTRLVSEYARSIGSVIEPGSPWENGYIESFNGKLRDKLLTLEIFDAFLKAQVLYGRWRRQYDAVRAHSSLGHRPLAPDATSSWPPGACSHQEIRMGVTQKSGSFPGAGHLAELTNKGVLRGLVDRSPSAFLTTPQEWGAGSRSDPVGLARYLP